jgi:uncharacterized protein YjaG (DUF416 family)
MTHVILSFDESWNLRALAKLQPSSRVIAALLATTRLLPFYRLFHQLTGRGDARILDQIAQRLWSHCLGESEFTQAEAETALATNLELIPNEDEAWEPQTQACAEDAASALLYTLRTRISGDAREAAWALRCGYEAMDYQAQQALSNQPAETAYNEKALLAQPSVQMEVGRQRRDLRDLEAWERSGCSRLQLVELKRRNDADALLMAGTQEY